MIPYVLGLDIGIASVGWAVLRCNADGEPYKIEDLGVRIFDKAENPKNGDSLARPRRMARSQRRRLRRKNHRKQRIKNLLVQEGVITEGAMQTLFDESGFAKDVYTLRAEALDRALNNEEWTRVLVHLNQRRGYRSNSTAEASKDNDDGVLKQAIAENIRLMEEKGYRTAGEMFCMDPKFRCTMHDGTTLRKTRNTSGDYSFTITREMVEKEVATLFDAQRRFGSPYADAAFESRYAAILFGQRNFDEGPGGNSPYKQLDRRGNCTFEPNELRAFKACWTFEYFKLLQDINHIRIITKNMPDRRLTADERDSIIALAMRADSLAYTRLRKTLKLNDEQTFNMVRYNEKGIEECEKNTKLKTMQSYHEIRKALDKVRKGFINELSTDQLDSIGTALSLYKGDDRRREELRRLQLSDEVLEALLPLSFSKTGHLSLTAMKKIIPHLETGVNYDVACAEVYGDHRGRVDAKRGKLLSFNDLKEQGALDGITSPVVLRAVSQTCKVVNAIIRKYGSPVRIHVELTREMSHTFDERNKIEKKQLENRAKNEKVLEQIEEIKGGRATGWDLVKFRLFKEQNETCLYSGKKLDITRLYEPGYVDVGHIIPFSVSFDDSYNNKVLVLTEENRNKGDQLPLEYMANDPEKAERFRTLVESTIKNFRKKQNLLKTNLPDDVRHDLKNRHLIDTQYIARIVCDILTNYLEFAESGHKRKVVPINHPITDFILKRYGLRAEKENGDLHYAMSAAVLATITPGMITRISNYSLRRERGQKVGNSYIDMETGEVMTKDAYDEKFSPIFPTPWPWFRKELEARLSPYPWEELMSLNIPGYDSETDAHPVTVSRMPRRKVAGEVHKATVFSAKEPGYAIKRTALTDLRLTKDGLDIEGYYDLARGSDPRLYNALRDRLIECDGDAKKAFAEPFYKPKKDGTPGPIVHAVKTCSTLKINVPVRGGAAENGNGSMVRIDIFRVEDEGLFIVPVYLKDSAATILPNRAVRTGKSYSECPEMREEDFVCSLYPGDMIYLEKKKGMPFHAKNKNATIQQDVHRLSGAFYYVSTDIASGTMTLTTHDRSYEGRGISLNGVTSFRKIQVDVLGECHDVKLPETRQNFR